MVLAHLATTRDEAKPLKERDPYFTDLLGEYENLPTGREAQASLSEDKSQPRDNHLPEYIRQGRFPLQDQQTDTWATTKLVRESTVIDPVERNPDRDISPPKQYIIQIGTKRHEEQLEDHTNMAFVYQPDGRCVGTVSTQRIHQLRTQYEHTKAHYPNLHRELGATTFAQDVAKLIKRHSVPHKGCTADRWTCPEQLMASLREHLGIMGERFASPLDHSSHMMQYWSKYPEDQLFGAKHDALSVPWTGPSQAHTGLDIELCEKGVRWAISSAEAIPDTPTCTIMVIPFAKGDPTMKHLQHPYTRIIAHVESSDKGAMQFLQPRHWEGDTNESHAQQKHPRTMIVVAIANAAGRDKHLSDESVSAFQESWGREPPDLMFGTYATKSADYKVKSPYALSKLIEKRDHTPTCDPHAGSPDHTRTYPCDFPLSAPDEGAVYTDGSCIKVKNEEQRIGAAVYIQKNGVTIRVNPDGKGPTNTITRAELSAIHIALTQVSDNSEDIHLYTDSACSIHMIRRILDSPWTLRESKHLQLLNSILDALRARAEAGGKTYIYKVRSHTGVAGNEAADVGAVEAAKHPNKTQVTEHSENNPYSKRTWAAHAPKQEVPGAAPDGGPRYVSSLRDGVKKLIAQKYSGGATANTGIYDTAWAESIPSMHKPSSFHFWKDSQIPHRLKKLTIKARWGHLWNRKLAHRYGLAPNPNCPMCGQPDSTGHLLGGCHHPEARGITILRHDQAVGMIQKTISTSSLGGFYTVMDAGAASNLPDDVQGKRLPAWLFPSTANISEARAQDAIRLRLRPDILVIEGLTAQAASGHTDEIRRTLPQCKIHIFEVGYCRDTDHKQKDDDKRKQHEELTNLLQSYGYKVVNHDPITLGRTGTIPASLITTLRGTFGLTAHKSKSEETAKTLARHAIRYLDKLYTHRQVHEATHKTRPTHNHRRPAG